MRVRAAIACTATLAVVTLAQGADLPGAAAKPVAETPLYQLPYTPSLDLPSMDRSVDPCVDFYQFACGGWVKANPIPGDQSSWSVYGKLYEDNARFLWGILEEASHPAPGRSAVTREIGDYFAACTDEPAVEKAGATPLQPALARIAAIASFGDLASFVAHEHLTTAGNHLMFGFGSNQDFGDSSRVIAFATAGGLGLPDRDYYVKDDARSREIRERYLAHVQRMLELLGEVPASAAGNAAAVVRLETALAAASLTRVERRDPDRLHHLLTRAELQALTPHFPWTVYFDAAGLPAYEAVNVTEPAFFARLDKELAATGLAVWKEYLRWHLVRDKAPYLSSAFASADFDFYRRYLRGAAEMQPRWKRCVQWVDRDLGEALGQAFVAKTFTPDTKARAEKMVVGIQKAMEEEITSLPWMGPATKRQALEKLHAMVNKVGYPERWRDYSSVVIARDDLFGNVTRSAEFESRRQLAKIGKPIDRGEWQMTPPTVNAYYDPQMNDINFPAGVLQPPLFDARLDDAPNYGDTGATIGHELTHGFDDEGRRFDARGNLRDWWTAADAAEFERRASCISDQYSHYVAVDDVKVNGKLTLGEDVADLGGEILAYRAWRAATSGEKLTAIDGFTPEQRFFIGMGQWACSNSTDEERRVRAVTDPHSPPKYRINGVVSNMPEFRAAFGCRPGQPMVREPICRVW
ncbi:MAG: M13 family metallopeptidase [Acidobacteriota bacterium]